MIAFVLANNGAFLSLLLALLTISEALPFVKKYPNANGIIQSIVEMLKKKGAAPSTLLVLAFLLPLAACAVPSPIPTSLDGGTTNLQKYDAALAQCEKDENISATTGPQGMQILQILETGGFSQQQIVQKIETIGVTAAGAEVAILESCAVLAYLQVNPVSSNAKPTPSQAAARVYQAKHLKVLKHTGPTVSAAK